LQEAAYVIDSFAWWEYFSGSSAGAKARPFIEDGNGITPTIVVAELSEKYRKEKLHLDDDLDFIISKTRIVPLSVEIALEAGKLSHDRKRKIKHWGMADSIVLATAIEFNAKVVTGDEHFRDLTHEAAMIK
jgi:predicted nucleic acid-binding protein